MHEPTESLAGFTLTQKAAVELTRALHGNARALAVAKSFNWTTTDPPAF